MVRIEVHPVGDKPEIRLTIEGPKGVANLSFLTDDRGSALEVANMLRTLASYLGMVQ